MSIQTMEARIQYLGGDKLGRMNKQKLISFKSALKNDYNTRMIKVPNNSVWPCLINTNNLKPDYDKKIISVDFDSYLKPGDVIEVLDNGSHWMIYLADLVETAYLKSEIIRCRYNIEIDGNKYWVYFRGPVETDTRWNDKEDIYFNELNLSGILYIKNDDITKNIFKRFYKFKLDNHIWEVNATDSISVPGILEVSISEYFDDPIAELPSIVKENEVDVIIGKTTVKQDDIIGYTIPDNIYNKDYTWQVSGNQKVKIEKVSNGGKTCTVKVYSGAIKKFTISYGKIYTKEVNIDISIPVIHGDTEVYPYEIKEYKVIYEETYTEEGEPVVPPVGQCSFSINNDKAKIISSSSNSCKIEITSSKTGEFIIAAAADGKTYTLPVKILSL